MMESIGFTASRTIVGYEDRIGRLLDELPPAREYITGACVGGDAFIGRWMYEKHIHDAFHTVYVPWNKSLVDKWWESLELWDDFDIVDIRLMPAGSTYKDRDQKVVDSSELLVAFPMYPENHPKSLRSGTWLTIRLARKVNVPVQIHVLKS